jgi:Protein-disulfide isomerase
MAKSLNVYKFGEKMSKRKEIREQHHDEMIRNRILVIGLVTAGVLVIVLALIVPGINSARSHSGATDQTIAVTPITTRAITVKVDGRHLGDPNAPVKVDVWEDFQCSSCRFYSVNVEPKIINNYVEAGKVYYTYHFYPFVDGSSVGGESHQAANAALCASDQGRFWDYHDILIANWNGENQGSFSAAHLIAFAENLGLDMTTFNQCFQANTYANLINQDMLAGQTAGVHKNGTPSLFINGLLLTPGYVPTYDQAASAIEAALVGK